MLNRSASLAMSTRVLKALPGKLDIKRHSPSILFFLFNPFHSVNRYLRERSGSMVECLTRDLGVAGSSLTRVTVVSLSKTH